MAAARALGLVSAGPFIEDERTSAYTNAVSPGLDNIVDALPVMDFRLWWRKRRWWWNYRSSPLRRAADDCQILRRGHRGDGRHDHADVHVV